MQHDQPKGSHLSFVTWVGTPLEVARMMLSIAEVSPGDVVCDLGSGDGRLLIMAVKDFAARKAIGYEIRNDLCRIAERKVQLLNLGHRISIVRRNLLEADISEASLITLYLSSEANEILRPRLETCAKPQTRVVSYLFPINGWRAAMQVDLERFSFRQARFVGALYLYVVPQAFSRTSQQ